MSSGPSADGPPEIEGLDDDATTSGWADYPLDSVFVRKEERSVAETVKRIRNKRYQLDPDFQRDFVWKIEKQSKLIESCVMRIPLPVFYVAEALDGKIIVVDGLQRLTTFYRFLENLVVLRGLAKASDGTEHPLEGKRFRDLSLTLRERIEDTQLVLYILDSKAPERARLDIFDRVNSGEPLTRQQMRNSLHNGPATRWLRDVSKSELFLDATGGSLDALKMRDREAINRFCAFKVLGHKTYRGGDMDGFLSEALNRMNAMPDSDLSDLRREFDNSMRHNYELFGSHAFRKSLRDQSPGSRRSVLNIALFDVLSEFFSDVTGKFDSRSKTTIRRKVAELLNDVDFNLAISFSTNSTNAVRTRFEMAAESLAELFK
jgi:hypothetical protein